jgi:hypothetical protein
MCLKTKCREECLVRRSRSAVEGQGQCRDCLVQTFTWVDCRRTEAAMSAADNSGGLNSMRIEYKFGMAPLHHPARVRGAGILCRGTARYWPPFNDVKAVGWKRHILLLFLKLTHFLLFLLWNHWSNLDEIGHLWFTFPLWERHSSVGIVVKLGARPSGVRLPAGSRVFLLLNLLEWLWGLTKPAFKWIPGALWGGGG